jgi:hypothetical protein
LKTLNKTLEGLINHRLQMINVENGAGIARDKSCKNPGFIAQLQNVLISKCPIKKKFICESFNFHRKYRTFHELSQKNTQKIANTMEIFKKTEMFPIQCCGSGMFIPYPGSKFFSIPDLGLKRFPDPGSGSASASKNWSILIQKLFPRSRKYNPGPDLDFLPILDPGVKKAPDPGSGSATLSLSLLFSEIFLDF